VFGIIRPCRHRLSPELRSAWLGHLCGLCLALRDEHGHLARLVTNYDGLLVSVLVEAQRPGPPERRRAGPCLLRGLRSADVAVGGGARLAAAVSLALAAAKTSDHVADRDGLFRHRPGAAVGRLVGGRWADRATRTARAIGFDVNGLLDSPARQRAVEAAIEPGHALEAATGPTESAVAAAFAHTAVLAGRPDNTGPLSEAGRHFGRLAHLLDAVADLAQDRRSGAWNPIEATGAGMDGARRLCDGAVSGLRQALRRLELADGRLIHALLAHEAGHAVRRAFGECRPALVLAYADAPPGGPPQPPPPAPPRRPSPRGYDPGPIGQPGPPPPARRGLDCDLCDCLECDGCCDCCCSGCECCSGCHCPC
jgi:hypothetical protein